MAKTIGLVVMSLEQGNRASGEGGTGIQKRGLDPARKVLIKRKEMRELQAAGLSL